MRYLLQNAAFIARDFARNIPKSLLSSLGIIFLMAFLMLYLSLRQGVREYIGGTLFEGMKINEMVISPPGADIDIFNLKGGQAAIPADTVRRVLAIPGISEYYSILRLDYPVRIEIDRLGIYVDEYVPIFGIYREYLRKLGKRWQDFSAGDSVPVIVPAFVLEIFNNMTDARGLPQFGEKALRGFPLDLKIQTSGRTDARRTFVRFDAEVYDFLGAVSLSGLMVPADFIMAFCAEHRGERAARAEGYSFIRLFITVNGVKDIPEVARAVQALGLRVDSMKDVAGRTNRALTIIDTSSLVVVGIFLLLTVVAIFNAYLSTVYHRSRHFSLLRVIGMSKFRIVTVFVLEAAAVGALYGIAGYFLGRALTVHATDLLGNWLPVLRGLIMADDGARYLPLAVALSAAVSSASALVPAVAAANMNLFQAVQK